MGTQQPHDNQNDMTKRSRELAEDLLSFMDESVSPFHGAQVLSQRLIAAGFDELDECDPFSLKPKQRAFVRRGDTALIAVVAGSELPSQAGFSMVGGHTDSPALRLKPRPEFWSNGLVYLGVELYGGPLLATWMDRDLGICGRVLVSLDGTSIERRLFKSDAPLVCLANAAIHINRNANDEGLKLNPQTELAPIFCTLNESTERHAPLNSYLAGSLNVRPDQILGFDLQLYDTQPATFGGLGAEFIRSGRLDDLSMCHAAVTALIAAADHESEKTRLIVCFDSEEVGSSTRQGAQSNFLPSTLERVCQALGDDRQAFMCALARSSFLSADNAHAVHPGYEGRAEPNHAPRLNAGPVIKIHASRAYATSGFSGAQFELVCRQAGVPVQRFVNRSDVRSGSTIGSMIAAQLGVPTADIGNPQLAMHSIRELAGTYDQYYMTKALRVYFEDGSARA